MSTTKVALVTGANKGIGFETVRQLAEQGVTVLLGARSLDKAQAAAAELPGLPVVPVVIDVTKSSDIAALAALIGEKYGHLDILINNAGVLLDGELTNPNSTETVTQKTLRDTFDTNFFAVIEVTQALLPLLKKAPAGRIVNLSSILGSLTFHATPGSPIYESKLFAYNASKTALNAFTVHLAHALKGTAIKVNSVHPGWVQTEMGGASAPMGIEDGARTSVQMALLGEEGPTAGFVHLGETLPW